MLWHSSLAWLYPAVVWAIYCWPIHTKNNNKKTKTKKKGNVVVLDIFLFTSRDCVGFNANANCRWSILKRPHTIHNESRLKWNFDAIRFDWPSCFFFSVSHRMTPTKGSWQMRFISSQTYMVLSFFSVYAYQFCAAKT